MAATERVSIKDTERKEGVGVSVIIPCYRCGDTIERAVASVAAQTWRPAEVILVDDASNDGTLDVLQALQSCYGDWIRIVAQGRNGGPGVARNAGWEAATQPYLAFLDADDAWHPRKIEIQLQYMESHPLVVISGHRRLWLQTQNQRIPLLPGYYVARAISRWRLLMSNCWATPTIMLRRELGFRFDPGKRYSEDYLLWLQLICSAHVGVHIDLALAYLYKAPYGAGGLSGRMWAMERGELANYWILRKERLISRAAWIGASGFSMAKYVRRALVWRVRRWTGFRLG